jgi:hypothetical protein
MIGRRSCDDGSVKPAGVGKREEGMKTDCD